MKKILTVIIPTYNMEKFLSRCLNSLIIDNDELLSTAEILVVIDGATDHSSEIAHSFEDKYPGIVRVIDKENGNYGSCINRGLAEALGRYVKVLDADDYFKKEEFEKYLALLSDSKSDMVLNNCTKVDESNCRVGSFTIAGIAPNKEIPFASILKKAVWFQMHCVAYRTDVVRSLGYVQTEGVSYTDQQWVTRPMSAVKTVVFFDLDLYQYLVGRAGQTMDVSTLAKKFKDERVMVDGMLTWIRGPFKDEIEREYLTEKILHHLQYLCYNRIVEGLYDEIEFRSFLNDIIRRYSWLKPMLENISVCDGVEYKFIREYLSNENFRVPVKVLKQIDRAKKIKKIKIFVGNMLRKIGLRN